MIMSVRTTGLVAVLLVTIVKVVSQADHFVLTHVNPLAMTRMDPIVAPGKVASHMHTIFGASNFGMDMKTPEQQQQAACSSTIVGADKSSYWSPSLMYRYSNGSLGAMLGGARIYYFIKSPNTKPYPPGLRMISGSAFARDLTSLQTQGLRLSCDGGPQTPWLPNATSHPGGCKSIALGIMFPSCGWANQSLDSPDHFSHMTWPVDSGGGKTWININGGTCPPSHPIKYPTIFYEVTHWFAAEQPWRNDPNLLVLSNGDTTGNNFHADFINGWDQQVLTDTISQCGPGKGPQDQLQNCAPLAKSLQPSAMYDCRLEGKVVDEDVGLYRPIPSLPGCNPIWPSSSNTKPTCSDADPQPGVVGPNAAFTNLQYYLHIPLALPFSFDPATVKKKFFPSIGASSSGIIGWGTEGSNRASMTVGSLADILANRAGGSVSGNSTSTSADAGYGTSTSSPTTATAQSSSKAATASSSSGVSSTASDKTGTLIADVASSGSTSTKSASSPNSTSSSSGSCNCTCKRSKKRYFDIDEQDLVAREVKAHQARRHKRVALAGGLH